MCKYRFMGIVSSNCIKFCGYYFQTEKDNGCCTTAELQMHHNKFTVKMNG
jgi:hypothetical protein